MRGQIPFKGDDTTAAINCLVTCARGGDTEILQRDLYQVEVSHFRNFNLVLKRRVLYSVEEIRKHIRRSEQIFFSLSLVWDAG